MFLYRLKTTHETGLVNVLLKRWIKKLKAIGAYTRKVAKSGLKKRKGPSKPGGPPNVHSNKLKGRTLFNVSERWLSVATGPAVSDTGTARIIEFGGRTKVTAGFNRGKIIEVQPRPWMGPAQERTLPAIGRIIQE